MNSQAFETEDCIDNQWDNGTTGNYWGVDYINSYPSTTNDGKIWNIPYEIRGSGTGTDYFPLVNGIITDFDLYKPLFTDIPENPSEHEGYSNLSISWIAIDLYPATYTIELDGNEVISPTAWTSGSAITYDIPNDMLKGYYNITIIVTDESGNTVHETVIFTVNDEITPQFVHVPEDFSYPEGYSGLNISWIVTDSYPATYTIVKKNGIEVVSATAWTNGSTITYNVPDGLLDGEYQYTIIVTDESGNISQDTVIFTVTSTETTTTPTTTTPIATTTTTSTPSWNALLLLLSLFAILSWRHRKKKS